MRCFMLIWEETALILETNSNLFLLSSILYPHFIASFDLIVFECFFSKTILLLELMNSQFVYNAHSHPHSTFNYSYLNYLRSFFIHSGK
jgi:hypothetical protein